MHTDTEGRIRRKPRRHLNETNSEKKDRRTNYNKKQRHIYILTIKMKSIYLTHKNPTQGFEERMGCPRSRRNKEDSQSSLDPTL